MSRETCSTANFFNVSFDNIKALTCAVVLASRPMAHQAPDPLVSSGVPPAPPVPPTVVPVVSPVPIAIMVSNWCDKPAQQDFNPGMEMGMKIYNKKLISHLYDKKYSLQKSMQKTNLTILAVPTNWDGTVALCSDQNKKVNYALSEY